MHPGEQYESERGKRLAPMHAAEQAAGAVFFETAGWERPFWYESNDGLLEEYGDAVMPREHEWDARWWSPIINAEHLAMRERPASSTSPRSRSSTWSGPARWTSSSGPSSRSPTSPSAG